MRPIDADALMQAMYHRAFETDGDTMWQSGCWVRYRAVEQVVNERPTIEQETPTGKWKTCEDGSGTCSVCGITQKAVWDLDGWQNFCGHCGAKMEGTK